MTSMNLSELTPALLKVFLYIAFKGPVYPKAVAEGTKISPGTVRPALRELLRRGYVIQMKYGRYDSEIPFTDLLLQFYKGAKVPEREVKEASIEEPKDLEELVFERELREAGYPQREVRRIILEELRAAAEARDGRGDEG